MAEVKRRGRVFVVQETLRKGPDGFETAMDLTPAAVYGDLVNLLPPGKSPLSGQPAVHELQRALANYGDEDYLLAVGAPTFIGWATAIAAMANLGRVRMLVWDRSARSYIEVAARLWGRDTPTERPVAERSEAL